jgi:hypothetical protein
VEPLQDLNSHLTFMSKRKKEKEKEREREREREREERFASKISTCHRSKKIVGLDELREKNDVLKSDIKKMKFHCPAEPDKSH